MPGGGPGFGENVDALCRRQFIEDMTNDDEVVGRPVARARDVLAELLHRSVMRPMKGLGEYIEVRILFNRGDGLE